MVLQHQSKVAVHLELRESKPTFDPPIPSPPWPRINTRVLFCKPPVPANCCSGVRPDTHPCPTQFPFFTCFIQIVRVTCRVPETVQNSGRDNPHYKALLDVEVPEMSENPTQSLIHNIIWRRTQLLAVILCIIFYIYIYI